MCSILLWFCHALFVIFIFKNASCNPVSNNFNASLRDYTVKEDDINSTNIRTLQKEELGRYASFAPIRNPITFKEIPDNALSSSSYSRGLLHHDHSGGYGPHEYEDPHHGHGYEYHLFDPDHHSGYDHHHSGHHGGHHHLGYGHHHKHYDHGLATKALLWPIAGIALLGAAAALASNPVLLQLGVISGRRRRRDTEEVFGPDFEAKTLTKWSANEPDKNGEIHDVPSKVNANGFSKKAMKRRMFKEAKGLLSFKAYPTVQSTIESVMLDAPERYNRDDEENFIPVPLKVKSN